MHTPPRPDRLRLRVQAAFCLLCLYAGWRFLQFILWARGQSEVFVPRPPSVEGFLPISALMAAKRLATTGSWDPVHPAGLAILLAALGMALLFRRGFCAYVCPVGFIHNLLERAGRALGLTREPGPRTAAALGAPRYLLLAFFVWSTWFAMDGPTLGRFLSSTYNITADARLLDFFLSPAPAAVAVPAVLAVLGLVVRNFWCRFLCPYGALLGLAALASPLAMVRDPQACTGCGRCTRACPSGIRVRDMLRVNSPQCMGCMQCAGVCPAEGCLAPALPGRRRAPLYLAAAGCVALLAAVWIWARATGHWDNGLPPAMLKRLYMTAG